MSTNSNAIESSSDAVASTELPTNSDVALTNEVKITVGDDLSVSNTETLTTEVTEPSPDHDGGGTVVHDSVNDARVSGDEREISTENVEKVLDENGEEVNHEEKEGEYKVSDLVWAKVRNYPWWPGQIFDPSSSTDVARKYSNKKGILIAYFGDQSFAWNEKSKIKPFRKNFFKMEKQSTSTKFLHAVDCALKEALRRIEFGLSCSCLPKQVFDKIKSQTVVNAGIKKEDSEIHGGDNFSTVDTFKPANIVQSLHDLAKEHFDGFNKLQVLSINTQLFAYYRYKGYHQFSTRYFLDGLDIKLEDNSNLTEIPVTEKPVSVDEKVSSKERKFKDSKTVKDEKPVSIIAKVSKKDLKKRKLNDSDDVNSKKHKQRHNGDVNSKKKERILTKEGSKSRNGIVDRKSSIPTPKRLFGIGDSICKIAKQLSVSPLIPKKVSESGSELRKESNSDSNDENCVDQIEESTKSEKEKFVALILKFTNFDSIPSVLELNEIFRKYGNLMESETEVLKKSNCGKVVFEEKRNAESAFSSAGKFSIFGPSLISYRLDYSPTPRRIYTRKGKKKNGKSVGVIQFDE